MTTESQESRRHVSLYDMASEMASDLSQDPQRREINIAAIIAIVLELLEECDVFSSSDIAARVTANQPSIEDRVLVYRELRRTGGFYGRGLRKASEAFWNVASRQRAEDVEAVCDDCRGGGMFL